MKLPKYIHSTVHCDCVEGMVQCIEIQRANNEDCTDDLSTCDVQSANNQGPVNARKMRLVHFLCTVE